MFARTKRLTLRPGWPEDAPALAAAIGHEQVVNRLSRVPWPYTVADAEEFLNRPHAAAETAMLIVTAGGASPRIVGGIGIHPEAGFHELGYWLRPAEWGRGYATEAGRQMIEIARHAFGLKRLVARRFIDNPASGRVLAKLGFVQVGGIETLFCRSRGHDVACLRLERDLAEESGDAQVLAA